MTDERIKSLSAKLYSYIFNAIDDHDVTDFERSRISAAMMLAFEGQCRRIPPAPTKVSLLPEDYGYDPKKIRTSINLPPGEELSVDFLDSGNVRAGVRSSRSMVKSILEHAGYTVAND